MPVTVPGFSNCNFQFPGLQHGKKFLARHDFQVYSGIFKKRQILFNDNRQQAGCHRFCRTYPDNPACRGISSRKIPHILCKRIILAKYLSGMYKKKFSLGCK